MPIRRLADMTWEEVRDLDRGASVALLPVGAMEAHGPHLPLATDVIIAEAMARRCAEILSGDGVTALLLPPLWTTHAGFAAGFPGTVSVAPSTVTALIRETAASLAAQGFGVLGVANAHLDPGHLGSLRAVTDDPPGGMRIAFVDLTRRAVAQRLTEEFRTGACHAGRFEGSVVLAETPELFRGDVAATLAPNPASLSTAIREGHGTFQDAGGERAYFGWPADASAKEGRHTVDVLGTLLAEAVADAGRDP
ncbi:MAG TPA: creatininase family protein [Longimicrobiales bacterium]|nr:creatininase family protein [Longimicrobiales bacterium]